MTSFNVTVTLNMTPADGEILVNTALMSTDLAGDDPANNTDTAETTAYPMVTIYEIQFVPESVGGTFPSGLLNQMVWVEGVVVAESGEVNNANTFVIADPSGGPWSGQECLYLWRPSGRS